MRKYFSEENKVIVPYNGYEIDRNRLSWQWGQRSEDSFLKPDHCREKHKTSDETKKKSLTDLDQALMFGWRHSWWTKVLSCLTCGCSCFHEGAAGLRWSQKPFSEESRDPWLAGLESSHLLCAELEDISSGPPVFISQQQQMSSMCMYGSRWFQYIMHFSLKNITKTCCKTIKLIYFLIRCILL